MADFENRLISRIFGVFSGGFCAQNNFNGFVEWFFVCFWHFYFLTHTDHFAKAIALAWAITFARWSIFKIVLFLEYLVFLRAVFLHRTASMYLYHGLNIWCFFERFFAHNSLNVFVEWFFACFWDF